MNQSLRVQELSISGADNGMYTTTSGGTGPSLGVAEGYAVLADTAITNTGPSVITGDIGVSPGSAITGFPPGTVIGTIHTTDASAAQARIDMHAAYLALQALTPTATLTGMDLGGM